MGMPLEDITIYYEGQVINDPDGSLFVRAANYIADFYHDSLKGYKPPKTGRICIHLGPTKMWNKPFYFGSVCSYSNIIDEAKYLTLTKTKKYKYILDLLHSTILELAEIYNWNKAIFNDSYDHIINKDFKFERSFSEKRSRDKKIKAQAILNKTEDKSTISVLISDGPILNRIVLLEKRNWYWYDSVYELAKSCKWLDNSSFGIIKNGKKCYYSVHEDRVVNDLVFAETDL